MKASELKNTPWTVVEQDTPQGITGIYEVEDYVGNVVAASITNKPTAKAIASLPDTLKELEAVKAELKGFKRAEEHQRKNAVIALIELGTLNEAFTQAEEKIKAEASYRQMEGANTASWEGGARWMLRTLKSVLEK